MLKLLNDLVNALISNPTIDGLEKKVLDGYESLGKARAECKTSTDKPNVSQSEVA